MFTFSELFLGLIVGAVSLGYTGVAAVLFVVTAASVIVSVDIVFFLFLDVVFDPFSPGSNNYHEGARVKNRPRG